MEERCEGQVAECFPSYEEVAYLKKSWSKAVGKCGGFLHSHRKMIVNINPELEIKLGSDITLHSVNSPRVSISNLQGCISQLPIFQERTFGE